MKAAVTQFTLDMRTGIRSSIGFLIVLFTLSQFFTNSFKALDNAATESFRTLEAAAIRSQNELSKQ